MVTGFRRGVCAVLLLVAGCVRPRHRDFVVVAPDAMVPGQVGARGAIHVVPPNAVDDRSAVLVYCAGADVVDPAGRNAGFATTRIRLSFRARNDESVPLTMDPGNVIVVLDPDTTRPNVLLPSRTVVDAGSVAPGGELIVAPHTTAVWHLQFDLVTTGDPFMALQSFVVSWTYWLDDTAYEEQTRFVARGAYTDSAVHAPMTSGRHIEGEGS